MGMPNFSVKKNVTESSDEKMPKRLTSKLFKSLKLKRQRHLNKNILRSSKGNGRWRVVTRRQRLLSGRPSESDNQQTSKSMSHEDAANLGVK